MIDLASAFRGEKSFDEVLGGLSADDLSRETAELFDRLQAAVFDCVDADVTFVYDDPSAGEEGAWNLAHAIVHLTASAEESAFLGAEQARGVPFHGRSRVEVPWESVTGIEQVRQRIAESRRMCLACLGVWPDRPDLERTVETWPGGPVVNAAGRHALGLGHGFGHLVQVEEMVRQAKVARG